MKIIVLAFFFILITSNFIFAQNLSDKDISSIVRNSSKLTDPDSALRILNKVAYIASDRNINDTIKALYFEQLGQIYMDKNMLHQADSLFDLSKQIFFKNKNVSKQINILNSKANIQLYRGDNEKANIFYKEGLDLAIKVKDSLSIGMINYNLGHVYYNMGKYDEAIVCTTKAANIFKALKNNKKFIQSNQELAVIISKYDINKAIKTLTALNQDKLLDSFPTLKLINYANLGDLYGKKNSPDTSLTYLNKALELAKKLHLTYHEVNLYGSIANTYLLKREYQKAIEIYNMERDLIPKESKFDLAVNYLNTGMAYYFIENPKKALYFYNNAEENSKLQKNEDFNQFIQKQKAYAYAKLNDYKTAFNLYKDASIKNDSIYSAKNAEKILELETKYQTKIKQDSLNLLNANHTILNHEITLSKNRNRFLWLGIAFFLILAAFLIYSLLERSKKNSLLEQKNHEIQTLSRENIHRIKNNLSLLSSMMQMQTRRINSKELKNIVIESESRLKVLTALEKILSTEENSNTEIEIKDYLTQIIENIIDFNSNQSMKIKANIAIDDIKLDADKSMKLGLIVNELITNSIKHADVIENILNINLKLKNESGVVMDYSDSGLTTEINSDFKNSDSLGLKLIRDLTNQIHGKLELNVDKGLKYKFYFANI